MKTRLVERKEYIDRVRKALDRAAVVALMGPRQCGKTWPVSERITACPIHKVQESLQ